MGVGWLFSFFCIGDLIGGGFFVLIVVCVFVLFFVIWWFVMVMGWVKLIFLFLLSVVGVKMWELVVDGMFWIDVGISIYCMFVGFFIVFVFVILIGIMIGCFKIWEVVIELFVDFVCYMLVVVFVFLMILWVGISDI